MKTLKKLLFIIMAVAVLAMPVFGVQAAESDIPVTEQPGVSPTPSPVPIRELVTKGNKIYYYYKGKMVKNKWKRYNGYKYYFGANGNAVRGGQRINNVVYVFDEKGRLFENKQNKIVKSGSNIYHIRTEHGRASIGYFIYKNNLYYADPKGRLYQKKSRQNGQLYFTNSGAARKDYNALLKMRVMQIVSSITNSGMSQSQKLYACWKYVVYGGFYYGGPDPNIYQSGWARSEALRMFRTGYGNCYGFSCIFAGTLDGNERIDSLNSEANAIREQTVYYDIRFRAYIPDNSEPVQLIINLEIQLNDTPGYPLVTRGFYYCARMISEQYGTVFTGEHYEKLQKVYSIWICPDPAKKRRNGIFRYYTVQDTVLGKPYESPDSYDLMEVVIVNLGDADKESDLEILDLLNTLFSLSISPETKKARLQDDFGIAMTEEFESEVQDMCNLGKALVEQGIEQGIEQGVEQGVKQKNLSLAKMMLEDKEPIDKIKKYTGFATDKLEEIAKSMGMTFTA